MKPRLLLYRANPKNFYEPNASILKAGHLKNRSSVWVIKTGREYTHVHAPGNWLNNFRTGFKIWATYPCESATAAGRHGQHYCAQLSAQPRCDQEKYKLNDGGERYVLGCSTGKKNISLWLNGWDSSVKQKNGYAIIKPPRAKLREWESSVHLTSTTSSPTSIKSDITSTSSPLFSWTTMPMAHVSVLVTAIALFNSIMRLMGLLPWAAHRKKVMKMGNLLRWHCANHARNLVFEKMILSRWKLLCLTYLDEFYHPRYSLDPFWDRKHWTHLGCVVINSISQFFTLLSMPFHSMLSEPPLADVDVYTCSPHRLNTSNFTCSTKRGHRTATSSGWPLPHHRSWHWRYR